MQRQLLEERALRTKTMIAAVGAALDALERGEPMKPGNMFESFRQALGDMYAADPRFAEKFESYGTGLAAFLRDAIRANAERR